MIEGSIGGGFGFLDSCLLSSRQRVHTLSYHGYTVLLVLLQLEEAV